MMKDGVRTELGGGAVDGKFSEGGEVRAAVLSLSSSEDEEEELE